MKKLTDILFSQKATLVLISIFAIAIAIATFIEDSYDTATAKSMVYNARWMEVLLFLLVINLIVIVFKRKLYRKGKITVFLFHLGFIFMIIGAGLTRYVGFEGTMHIREGQASNNIFTSESYFSVKNKENELVKQVRMDRNRAISDPFNFSFDIENKGEVEIEFKNYFVHAVEEIIENSVDGTDLLKVRVATQMGNVAGAISEGELVQVGGINFAFNSNSSNETIQIIKNADSLFVQSSKRLYLCDRTGKTVDSLEVGQKTEFKINQIYKSDSILFLFDKNYVKAKTQLVNGSPDNNHSDAIVAELTYKNQKHNIEVFGGNGYITNFVDFQFDDLNLKMGYGNKTVDLPFSLFLEDFRLERYPGSSNPSSFESDVVLIDDRKNLNEKHKIYMNNILDHDGYRFFQSSYDEDELGTILSVNNDMPGTLTTYFSYFLLCIGFISSFFTRGSRSSVLRRKIRKTRSDRKSVVATIILMIGLSVTGFSQNNSRSAVSGEHADKFGHLIVQTFDGRFEPVHTLAYDVLHKIYKKNSIKVEGKGKLSGMQFYLDLMIDSEFWKSQKIIYVKELSIQNIIGTNGKYASYNDFFNQNNQYKLSEFSEKAFMKNKADKNKFDKEIIKVNERLNILLMTFNGSMLKIFPDKNSINNKWVSLDDTAAHRPLTGSIRIINEDLQLNPLTFGSILQYYLHSVIEAKKTNNYDRADQILGYIDNIQRESSSADVIPGVSKINTEVHYNKANIFVSLKYIYMILSVILLLLAFADHLRAKKSKMLSYTLNFFIVLLAAAFLYHTYGLVLRWYLSGHAPWSNGYEALVFVAWGGLLAGFSFVRYSKITLAATALLGFLIMLVAGFSSYDPQLTNLQPVLKSYWLIIHVAVIVISYGFFGLGFILGLMNLVIYLFKNRENSSKLDLSIKDLTNINEMVLIIGIVLATIGTFLGAVWANESWGRYWGWDAKETWALIILMVYAVVLHLRLVPGLNKRFIFNVGSVLAFASVIMTFFGVNYYFSKGLHSYASGDKAAFPLWIALIVVAFLGLIYGAYIKHKKYGEIKP